MANSVDLDEMAHHEPPHQDLGCLQIQLFLSVVLKELNSIYFKMDITTKVTLYMYLCCKSSTHPIEA